MTSNHLWRDGGRASPGRRMSRTRVRPGVDHHAGQQQRDDQPEHATRDDVHNGTDNCGDDHAYGHEPEELTGTQSEPFVSITAGGLVQARLLPTAHRVCPGPPVRRLWLEPR